jgi:hypothetical protein
MAGSTLDGRLRLAIELALTSGDDDPLRRRRQEDRARGLGLSGAEIDAARGGRSFDAQTSIALALATARGDEERRRQRLRALKAGISADACREIEAFAGLFATA